MSTFTKASLGMNVGLALLVTWLIRPVWPVSASRPAAPPEPLYQTPTQKLSPTVARTAVVQPPLRWSQLESTDYGTYVANLRGIGCPEQTIRDIISADLDSNWYAPRRRPLQETLSNAPRPESEAATRQAAEAELTRLRREESAVLAALLDIRPGEWHASRFTHLMSSPARMPLAFLPVDPQVLQFSESEIEFIRSVQQSFEEEIGGLNQETNTPEYRQRWEIAQREADSALRGMLGRRRFMEYEDQVEDAQP